MEGTRSFCYDRQDPSSLLLVFHLLEGVFALDEVTNELKLRPWWERVLPVEMWIQKLGRAF